MKQIRKIALMAVGDEAWMGGIQYIINLVAALNELGRSQPLEVHIFKHASQQFSGLEKFDQVQLQVLEIDKTLPPFSMDNRIKWKLQRELAGRINPRLENYLLSEGYDFAYPVLLSACGGRLNSAAWIADFQYHHFPDGAHPEATRAAEKVISTIANRAKKIVFSSQYCAADADQLFPVTRGKGFVMPFTVYIDEAHFTDAATDLLERYSLPEDYLMVSNLFAPTKHHQTLFAALGILRKEGLEINLVCTGNLVDYRNTAYANAIVQMLTENKIRQQVHLLGLIPRADQVALYRKARALVQPSVNEGWSTLVEEAKALGKDLIVSDIEVHREQCPGNPCFFKAGSATDLAQKIRDLYRKTPAPSFPDSERERLARASYTQKMKAFGQRFLEIAAA